MARSFACVVEVFGLCGSVRVLRGWDLGLVWFGHCLVWLGSLARVVRVRCLCGWGPLPVWWGSLACVVQPLACVAGLIGLCYRSLAYVVGVFGRCGSVLGVCGWGLLLVWIGPWGHWPV